MVVKLEGIVRPDVFLFDRFVVPFEVVSFVLLAALIGGIAIARKDDEGGER